MRRGLLLSATTILAAVVAGATSPGAKTPIIFDTDIGGDIDDAFALALIIKSPELDLLGVTTASGDTQARARLAAKMLSEAGLPHIPVAAGEPGKLSPLPQCRWADGFSSPAMTSVKAVDFLKEQFDRRPGEITLVPVGPLTNVGALLKLHPEVAKKIKRIVLMGGSVMVGYQPNSPPAPEYNILEDPAAAQVVFASGVPILMVPLDASAMLKLEADGRHRVFTRLTPTTNALALLYHLWNAPTPILFDPMAVAMIIDPTLCETKPMAIAVDDKGFTRPVEGKTANATVALKTDPQRFLDFYLDRVAPK